MEKILEKTTRTAISFSMAFMKCSGVCSYPYSYIVHIHEIVSEIIGYRKILYPLGMDIIDTKHKKIRVVAGQTFSNDFWIIMMVNC